MEVLSLEWIFPFRKMRSMRNAQFSKYFIQSGRYFNSITIGVVTPSPGSQISPRMRKWGEKNGANGEFLCMEDV